MTPIAVVAALCWAGGYRSIIGDSAMRWGSPPKPEQPTAMVATVGAPFSLVSLVMGADGRVQRALILDAFGPQGLGWPPCVQLADAQL